MPSATPPTSHLCCSTSGTSCSLCGWESTSTPRFSQTTGPAVEILSAILVAINSRYASFVVAAWLAVIIINLLTYSGFYDVALRDFGLLIGALALAALAARYDSPWARRSHPRTTVTQHFDG